MRMVSQQLKIRISSPPITKNKTHGKTTKAEEDGFKEAEEDNNNNQKDSVSQANSLRPSQRRINQDKITISVIW